MGDVIDRTAPRTQCRDSRSCEAKERVLGADVSRFLGARGRTDRADEDFGMSLLLARRLTRDHLRERGTAHEHRTEFPVGSDRRGTARPGRPPSTAPRDHPDPRWPRRRRPALRGPADTGTHGEE